MSEEIKITDVLRYIQSSISVPKKRENKFGRYQYRNCDDIFKALTPLLNQTKASLILSDEIVDVGGRIYVKVTAELRHGNDLIATNTSLAREPETKKGMDEAQITVSTSSYARKCALSGLLLLDDSIDPDDIAANGDKAEPNTSKPRVAHSVQVKKAVAAINSSVTIDQLKDTYSKQLAYFKKWSQPGHIETITAAKDEMKIKLGASK